MCYQIDLWDSFFCCCFDSVFLLLLLLSSRNENDSVWLLAQNVELDSPNLRRFIYIQFVVHLKHSSIHPAPVRSRILNSSNFVFTKKSKHTKKTITNFKEEFHSLYSGRRAPTAHVPGDLKNIYSIQAIHFVHTHTVVIQCNTLEQVPLYLINGIHWNLKFCLWSLLNHLSCCLSLD